MRSIAAINSVNEKIDNYSRRKVSAVAGLIAVASFSGAEAQQSNLPPVTVDAPCRAAASCGGNAFAGPCSRARTAFAAPHGAHSRRRSRRCRFPTPADCSADRNPYRDPAAPYKADRLQASGKFPEPLLNTPKTVTVLSKEVLADKNATTLRQAVLSTAGVTLGTGEGGNAFGDRFFIRGFDARNDVFLDGMRDAGVSVRENFFTEQVEIFRGPGSSFAGRGITGGAINIVTKQATTEKSFYNMDTTFATDQTKRVVLDVNQVISPTLAVRAAGLFQDAGVAGRDYIKDDRDGGFIAVKWTPLDTVKLHANYIHTNLHGLPDFGVPYYRPVRTRETLVHHAPQVVRSRISASTATISTGFVNRDYYSTKQDIGTFGGEVAIAPDLTLSNKSRVQRSVQDYIGNASGSSDRQKPDPALWTLSANPQSRYQVTENIANQTEATYKFLLRRLENTRAGRLRILARDSQSRQVYRLEFGSAARWVQRQRAHLPA